MRVTPPVRVSGICAYFGGRRRASTRATAFVFACLGVIGALVSAAAVHGAGLHEPGSSAARYLPARQHPASAQVHMPGLPIGLSLLAAMRGRARVLRDERT